MKLSKRDISLLIESLGVRICHMETGTPNIRAKEAHNYSTKRRTIISRPLDTDQMSEIIDMEKLRNKLIDLRNSK